MKKIKEGTAMGALISVFHPSKQDNYLGADESGRYMVFGPKNTQDVNYSVKDYHTGTVYLIDINDVNFGDESCEYDECTLYYDELVDLMDIDTIKAAAWKAIEK